MANPQADYKFFIRNTKGQQQMVKVVTGKPAVQGQSSSVNQVFKVPSTSENSIVIRNVNISGVKSKFVQLPIEQFKQLQRSSVDNSPAVQSSTTIKKLQSSNVSEVPKTIHTVPSLIQQSYDQDDKTVLTNKILRYKKRIVDYENGMVDYSSKRRKMVDKVGKGLRHFSMKVCEKVRRKVCTSYNEVADELVAEFAADLKACPDNQHYDHKNIRRRVYDALNVLMAMNIISKEKKEIRWLGLPSNTAQECHSLEAEKISKIERIKKKTSQLQELIIKQISFKCLVERNKEAENKGLIPTSTSAIQLPFIVINTNEKTLINCSISNDKMNYVFQFNDRFKINDDITILKKMGLDLGLDKGNCSIETLNKAKSMVPKSLENYVEYIAMGTTGFDVTAMNIKAEKEEFGESSFIDEPEMEDVDFDDSSMQYGGEGEEEHDESSDVDCM